MIDTSDDIRLLILARPRTELILHLILMIVLGRVPTPRRHAHGIDEPRQTLPPNPPPDPQERGLPDFTPHAHLKRHETQPITPTKATNDEIEGVFDNTELERRGGRGRRGRG